MSGKFKTKTRVFNRCWTVDDVKTRPNMLFIFDDNLLHEGKDGQAIIRDEHNTFGIPTKKAPTMEDSAFFTDDEYDDNTNIFKEHIIKLIKLSSKYQYIVFPKGGLGTGPADLPKKAPLTYKYLADAIAHFRTVI